MEGAGGGGCFEYQTSGAYLGGFSCWCVAQGDGKREEGVWAGVEVEVGGLGLRYGEESQVCGLGTAVLVF